MVLNSPGIAYREVDATVYPVTIDSSIVGIVGFADKGPENKATLITTPEQLVKTFGEPNENLYGQGLLAALEILETTNRIYYVRAASGSIEASATIPIATCPYVKFHTDYKNWFGVNNNASATYFLVKLKEDSTEIFNKIYTVPATSSDGGRYPTSIAALQAVFGDGTARGDLVAADIDSDDNLYIYGAYAGPRYVLEVSASLNSNGTTLTGSAFSAFFASSLGISADSGQVSAASGYGLQISSTEAAYLVQALYGGPGYNLGRSLRTGEVTGVSVTVDNILGPWFNINVNDKGYTNESFRVSFYGDNTFIEEVIKASENDTPLRSDYIKGDFAGNQAASATLVPLTSPANKLSQLFNNTFDEASGLKIEDSGYGPSAWEGSSSFGRFAKLKPGTYNLTGGMNGEGDSSDALSSLAATLIGTAAEKTGIYALDDDNLNISMAMVPGVFTANVQNALITLAETSQNFIAATAPPLGITTAQKAVDWMNGKGTVGDRKAAINSSYVALYWPHVQIFNTYTQRDVWMDPAIYGIRAMAFTDSISDPWFAPAGFNRGRLTKPLDTELVLSQGDRDILYENNLNPMVKFFPEGITIFGQKTGKRLPSATDRINVRRLMIYIRKNLLRNTRAYVFEPNDPITWDAVKTNVESLLRDIAGRRGIAESRVVCDSTINTPTRVSRRELWCKIILRPVEAAEYIIFEVNLTNNTSNIGA